MAVRIYPNMHRALFTGLTAVYYGGALAELRNAEGELLTGDLPPPVPVPTIISSIPTQSLTVGGAPVVIDLSDYIDGATSYETSALPSIASRTGGVLTLTPTAALTATDITVRGRNAGGVSADLTFAVAVAIAPPVRTQQATITPASGPVGTVFTVTPATFSGSAPLTRAGELRQAGVLVATRTNGTTVTFTSTAAGALEWSETATNATGVTATGAASATVTIAQIAPGLSGGSLTVDGDDVVITPPTATGSPTPTVVLSLLTRNGVNIQGEVINGRIPDGAIRGPDVQNYEAGWTADNGIGEPATAGASLSIDAEIVIPDPSFVITPIGTIEMDDIPEAGEVAFSLAEPADVAGSYTFDAAQLATQPVLLRSGALTFEDEALVYRPCMWGEDTDAINAQRSYMLLRNGQTTNQTFPPFTHDPIADAEVSFTVREVLQGTRNGQPYVSEPFISGSVLIPAYEPVAGAPAFAGTSTITGGQQVGDMLTVTVGPITGTPAPTVTYEWYLNDTLQVLQTEASFVRPAGSEGAYPSCVIKLDNFVGEPAYRVLLAEPTAGFVTMTLDGFTSNPSLVVPFTITMTSNGFTAVPA